MDTTTTAIPTIYVEATFLDPDGNHVETVRGSSAYVAGRAHSFLYTTTQDPEGQSEEDVTPAHLCGSIVFRPLNIDRNHLEEMTRGYATAALWADCMPPEDDEDGESGGREHLTMEPSSLGRMRDMCARFMLENADDLETYADAMDRSPEWSGWEMAGHDLRLTCGGHGAGFWDRELGELGDRLTTACRMFERESEQLTPMDMGDGTAEVLG